MTKIGRNDDCYCGKKISDGTTSIKYKKFCETKDACIILDQKKRAEKDVDDRWRRNFGRMNRTQFVRNAKR